MKLKQFIMEYLAFSRKERRAAISFLLIILCIYLIPTFYQLYSPSVKFRIDSNFYLEPLLPAVDHEEEADAVTVSSPAAYSNKSELFNFDPNLADISDWLRLGLSEKTALTIERYRKKGGRFYKKEDLQRIWGLPPGFYEKVKDHIVIPPKEQTAFPTYERKEYIPRDRITRVANINAADSTTFEALPGIGPKLSGRIVSFREKLGGFYSVDQVGETYGLPDSTFQKIRTLMAVDATAIRTININIATKEELKAHPYIRWNLANAIVAYRTQHGSFSKVDDLKQIAVIDEKTFEKLYRYVRVE